MQKTKDLAELESQYTPQCMTCNLPVRSVSREYDSLLEKVTTTYFCHGEKEVHVLTRREQLNDGTDNLALKRQVFFPDEEEQSWRW